MFLQVSVCPRGGFQAHTQGGGCPDLGPGVSQHALRQTDPPQQTAIAAGSMHPTGHQGFYSSKNKLPPPDGNWINSLMLNLMS